MTEELKKKILAGEELTEREVRDLRDYEVDEVKGENRRWERHNQIIVEIDGRFFQVEFEEGLTEEQENEYWPQVAVEVVKKEKQVTIAYWEKK